MNRHVVVYVYDVLHAYDTTVLQEIFSRSSTCKESGIFRDSLTSHQLSTSHTFGVICSLPFFPPSRQARKEVVVFASGADRCLLIHSLEGTRHLNRYH